MNGAGKYVFIGIGAIGLLCGVGGIAAAQQTPSSDTAAGAQAQDTKLEKRIDYRLQHDERLKNRSVDASVKDGMVTLTGTVKTSSEKARAERLAHTKGVTDVDNQIELQGAAQQGGAGA